MFHAKNEDAAFERGVGFRGGFKLKEPDAWLDFAQAGEIQRNRSCSNFVSFVNLSPRGAPTGMSVSERRPIGAGRMVRACDEKNFPSDAIFRRAYVLAAAVQAGELFAAMRGSAQGLVANDIVHSSLRRYGCALNLRRSRRL